MVLVSLLGLFNRLKKKSLFAFKNHFQRGRQTDRQIDREPTDRQIDREPTLKEFQIGALIILKP